MTCMLRIVRDLSSWYGREGCDLSKSPHDGLGARFDELAADGVLSFEVLVPPAHVVAGGSGGQLWLSDAKTETTYISDWVRSSRASSPWSTGVSISAESA